MSDSCSLTMTFRHDELKEFNEVLKDKMWHETFWDKEVHKENEITITVYEAGYGWYSELGELAKAELTFYGDHSKGGDYSACTFAGHAGKYSIVPSDRDGCPVVTVPRSIQINQTELDSVMEYWEIYRKAVEYIEKEKEDITSA